jgi:hypothetical protein
MQKIGEQRRLKRDWHNLSAIKTDWSSYFYGTKTPLKAFL